MPEYVIRPLVTSKLQVDKSFMLYFMNPGEKIKVAVAAFYIEGSDKNILVDTGCPASIIKKFWPEPSEDVQSFEDALNKVGLKPEEIDYVIQTHVHFDHCGNTSKCVNAKVVIQEDELKFALSPHPLFTGNYSRDLIRGWKYLIVKGDQDVFKGIRVLYTPGHSPGTQSVAVETSKGTAIIAGFCCLQENFKPPAEIPWDVFTPGIHTDALAAYDSMLRVKGLADIPVAMHDVDLPSKERIP